MFIKAIGPAPIRAEAPELVKGPILVVDDDLGILTTVSDILEAEGYAVETALNGEAALQVIRRRAPSLILLDMRMPVMNGWEFATRLRQMGIHLPIVVMTAARDARAWAGEIGAIAFLAKPFDLVELLEVIERHRR